MAEKVESEMSLQKSEKRFREIFESLQDVFFAIDVKGNILDMSPSIQNLLHMEIETEKLIGKNVKEFDQYLNIPDLNLAINNTIINNSLIDNEIVIHTPYGIDIVCSFCSQCYRNIAGEPERILGTLRNITRRKQSEKELKDQRLLYSSVMQYLPADAFRKDIEGRYLYVNQKMCNRLGLTESEIIGYTSAEVMQKQLELKRAASAVPQGDNDWRNGLALWHILVGHGRGTLRPYFNAWCYWCFVHFRYT